MTEATPFLQKYDITFLRPPTIRMGFCFCDCLQVLLPALPPTARKGECEGETFAGFPTRVQSPARRRPILRSKIAAPKKYDHPKGGRIFLERATRLELASRHPANGIAIRRNPASPLNLTRFAQVEAASSNLPAAFQKENTILTDGVSFWSGRRGSNSLPRPWQGRALPDELRPQTQGGLYRIFCGLSTLHFRFARKNQNQGPKALSTPSISPPRRCFQCWDRSSPSSPSCPVRPAPAPRSAAPAVPGYRWS